MTATSLAEAVAAPRVYVNMFMQIDLGGEVFRAWTGTRDTVYDGETYHGMAGMLSMSSSPSSVGVQAEELIVAFAHGGEQSTELNRIAMTHSIADNAFRAVVVVSDSDGFNNVYEAPFFTGKVSAVGVQKDRIEMTVYTAMLDATTTKSLARLWSDDHQRRYVDENDRVFRHVAGASTRPVEF